MKTGLFRSLVHSKPDEVHFGLVEPYMGPNRRTLLTQKIFFLSDNNQFHPFPHVTVCSKLDLVSSWTSFSRGIILHG